MASDEDLDFVYKRSPLIEIIAEVRTPILAKAERTYEGALWSGYASIRAISLGDSAEGAYCVGDDGLENYHAHAHLGFSLQVIQSCGTTGKQPAAT